MVAEATEIETRSTLRKMFGKLIRIILLLKFTNTMKKRVLLSRKTFGGVKYRVYKCKMFIHIDVTIDK